MPVASPDSASTHRARPWAFALALVGALVAAVLLAGPLTVAIDAVFHDEAEFAKVFRYLALGLMTVAIAVTLRPWKDVPPDLWGLLPRRGRPHGSPLRATETSHTASVRRNLLLVLVGFAMLVALLAAVASVHFAAGAVQWDRSPEAWGKFTKRLVKYLVPALAFALVEEAFFRGWLVDRFAAATRARSALVAGALASVVFGFVHAFHAQYAPVVSPGPAGALAILSSWGERVLDVGAFGPRFLGLSLFALALCGARARFRTIAFGIGAHAAAYSFLPLYSAITEPTAEPTAPSSGAALADARTWVGSKWLYDGVPGIAMLALLAFVLWRGAVSRRPDVARPPA